MEFWLAQLSHHGYSLLFAFVFMESVGIPVPAAIALLIAGAASSTRMLSTSWALTTALSAMLLGDTLMFLLGRYTGWWLLSLLCRLSLNPEACILRAADSFYRRGRTVLLFAKFVPGINTMAPPLAGSMNMRFLQFLGLDATGTAVYIGSYFGVGYLFSDALGSITRSYQAFSRVLGWVIVLLVAGYIVSQIWLWRKSRLLPPVPLVKPQEAAEVLEAGNGVVYDVRSHGYYDRKAQRIQGSRRLEPNAIRQAHEEFPERTMIFLYCTCVREATSSRVARELAQQGIHSAVIEGGLKAWIRAGLPIEPVPAEEMADLPVFDL